MKLTDTLLSTRGAMTATTVFAAPYERDGVTVLPAAVVRGGGGGGSGHGEDGQEGEGGGFGLTARPAGAFVIRDGTVRWQPALDVDRLVTVLGAVACAWLLGRRRRGGGTAP